MTDLPWVDYLIKLKDQGFAEIPGPESNPKILEWARVAAKYPYMNDDSTTPWCGIGLAGVFWDIGMKEAIPEGPAAAISWLNCGPPCEAKRGAVVVFPRPGGNHVAVILNVKGEILECIGANQNNAITIANFNINAARGFRWPKGAVMKDTKVDPVLANYKELLQRCQVKPEWQTHINRYATEIVKHKKRYREIEDATGVPWAIVGVIHYRESTLNFNTHLHNGDSLKDRTQNVPAGRPRQGEPPFTWEESAIDALEYDGLDEVKDWSMENICNVLEKYNGLGYRRMGLPSPYLWSGTNNYVRGKYVSDGNYAPGAIDKQAGCIPLYLRAMELAHEKVIRSKSRKINIIDNVVAGIKALFAVIGSLFTMDSFGIFKEWFSLASGVIDSKMLITLFIGAAFMWVILRWLDKLMMDDAKAGTWVPSGLAQPEPTPIPGQTIVETPPEVENAVADPNIKLD